MSCPSDNTQAVEQGSFWSSSGVHWDAHRVGWLISGVCALVVSSECFVFASGEPDLLDQTVVISTISILMHCQ